MSPQALGGEREPDIPEPCAPVGCAAGTSRSTALVLDTDLDVSSARGRAVYDDERVVPDVARHDPGDGALCSLVLRALGERKPYAGGL